MDTHQFSLFNHSEGRKGRVRTKITKEMIDQARAQMKSGDMGGLETSMRNIRERLENFERNIKTS